MIAGVCKAGVNHVAASAFYRLEVNSAIASGQPGWKRCLRCQALTYAGGGTCLASGGAHSCTGDDYTVLHGGQSEPAGTGIQLGWRYCFQCKGMFYTNGTASACPAGTSHNATQSGRYAVWCRVLGSFFVRTPVSSFSLGGGVLSLSFSKATGSAGPRGANLTAGTGGWEVPPEDTSWPTHLSFDVAFTEPGLADPPPGTVFGGTADVRRQAHLSAAAALAAWLSPHVYVPDRIIACQAYVEPGASALCLDLTRSVTILPLG